MGGGGGRTTITLLCTWTLEQQPTHNIVLLDLEASCSVLSKDHLSPLNIKSISRTKLVSADGRNITPCGITNVIVTLGPFSTKHSFIFVDHLSVPAILGCDSLREHGFVLDF